MELAFTNRSNHEHIVVNTIILALFVTLTRDNIIMMKINDIFHIRLRVIILERKEIIYKLLLYCQRVQCPQGRISLSKKSLTVSERSACTTRSHNDFHMHHRTCYTPLPEGGNRVHSGQPYSITVYI